MNSYLITGLAWGFFLGIASTVLIYWLSEIKFKKHIKQMKEGQPKE